MAYQCRLVSEGGEGRGGEGAHVSGQREECSASRYSTVRLSPPPARHRPTCVHQTHPPTTAYHAHTANHRQPPPLPNHRPSLGAEPIDSGLLPGLLAQRHGLLAAMIGATTLGKLGRYSCTADRPRRLSLVLMSVPLWRVPFALSLAHPARLSDYANYTPTAASLLAGVNLFSDHLQLSPDAMLSSLEVR